MFAAAMLLFLSGAVVIVGLGLEKRSELIEKAKKDAMLVVESMAAQQEQITTGTKYLLSTLAQAPTLQLRDTVACNELLRKINGLHPIFSMIAATNSDGILFAASKPFVPGTDLSDRKHFRDALRTREFSVGELVNGRITKTSSLYFAYPVLDNDSKVVAVVTAGFNVREYPGFVDRISIPEGFTVNLADHKGLRLHRIPENRAIPAGMPIPRDLYQLISGESDHGIAERVGQDGVHRIYAFKQLKLKQEASPYMYIVGGMASDQVVGQANSEIAVNLAFLGIIGTAALGLTLFFGNITIAVPIRKLVIAAQKIGGGELGARTGLPHTQDELGELAQSFDSMADLLENRRLEQKNTEEALNRAYAESEMLVRERTSELSAANLALVAEITERKYTGEALRDSERQLRQIIDLVPHLIFVKDWDGKYLLVNQAVAGGYKTSVSAVTGKCHADFSHDEVEIRRMLQDDRDVMMRAQTKFIPAQRYTDTKGDVHFLQITKVPFRRNGTKSGAQTEDGMRMPEDSGRRGVGGYAPASADAVLGIAIDITERKRAEEERMRLATAIEQSAEAIIITDTNWIIDYVNPAFTDLSGYDGSEVIGRHLRLLKSDKHDRAFYREIRETLAGGRSWSGRLINMKKDGSLFETEASSSPVRNKSGDIINHVSIHRDITCQVKLERDLRQAQKMEAIGTLAGGIAHDFNNILAAIVGYTEIASFRLPQEDPLRHNLEQVLKASARASDLVKRILAFSRQTEQNRQPVHVLLAVNETLELLRPSLPATIEIRKEIGLSTEEGVIFADPTEVHQILMNLCTNAAHAMRTSGGVLSVGLSYLVVAEKEDGKEEAEDDEYPSCGLRPATPSVPGPGSYVCLTISDTGHGMEPAVMERIFDPYFTTKKVGEGTGLGLSVVQGIVTTNGGAISVHSEPGKGTSFEVYFREMETSAPVLAKTRQALPTGAERILFVDDEQILAELGKELLGSLGYKVDAKTSSLEALETFKTDPHGFDLVITDMTMPGLRGEELAREIIALRPGMPVILCTGYSELIDERQAQEMGISEFIMKPYVVSSFTEAIRRALNKDETGC